MPMYYQVTQDDTIIDAIAGLICCKYVARSYAVLRCDKSDDPQGIISERTGTYYHVDGWSEFPDGTACETVTLKEIDKATYTALREALDAGETPEQPEETEYPPDATLEFIQTAKIAEMSKACNAAIVAGFDLALSDGQTHHFSLTTEDQINLISLQALVMAGQTTVPYHADGEECTFFTAEDFNAVAQAATNWKLYQESYFNSLRAYIQSMDTIAEVTAVQYGVEIPEEYQSDVLKTLTQGAET